MSTNQIPDLPYHDADVGTDGHHWTVTLWITDDVTLRLRIRHYSYEFEDEYSCEIKLHEAHDFTTIRRFRTMTSEFSDDCSRPMVRATLDLFPDPYRSAFLAMARHWSLVVQITQLTASAVTWREGAPVFSMSATTLCPTTRR